MAINIGVIGLGYWGPNLVRNFSRIGSCRIKWLCDLEPRKLQDMKRLCSHALITSDYTAVLKDNNTQAVVIATPFLTHYKIAKKALESGKHVFIEKPFVASESQAEELINIAKKKRVVLMIGYTYVYSPAVRKIKSIIDSGGLGSAYYINSVRVNFGIFRKEENVVWDLAVHDFSIISYWFDGLAESIMCTGRDSLKRGYADTALLAVNFKNNPTVYILASWLSPIKMRNMIIAGSKKMIFFNDERGTEKIKIYSQDSNLSKVSFSAEYQPRYNKSSVFSPWLECVESIEIEARHFINCIKNHENPITDGEFGLRVIKELQAADKSLKHNKTVYLTK